MCRVNQYREEVESIGFSVFEGREDAPFRSELIGEPLVAGEHVDDELRAGEQPRRPVLLLHAFRLVWC